MDTNELILRPTKYGGVFTIAVSSLFVYMGIGMIGQLPLMGWLTTVFFGLCLLVAVVQLWPGATSLKLTTEGFVVTSLFRSNFTRWQDVASFRPAHVGLRKMVVFDYVESHKKFAFGKRLAKGLAGNQAALPDTYGMTPKALAQLLNEWKDRAKEAASHG